MKFTLVSTIFNEENRLKDSINDIENQTLLPNEIIIVDAGSTDKTLEILEKWKSESSIKIVIIVKAGCNVAEGRNIAIENASHELIASTDFGCRYDPKWLESLIAPFKKNEVKVVAGNFSVKTEMLTSMAAKSAYLLARGYKNVMDNSFIPSSRSIAYYKKTWSNVGGYPEWVTLAGDDTYFGYQLKRAGYSFYLSKSPLVFWGRHLDASSYDKEAFRYGLGDGETRDAVNQRNAFIKAVELLLRLLFLISIILAFIIKPSWGPLIFATVCLIGFRAYFKVFRYWLKTSNEFKITHFVNALIMLERNRWYYLKGYIKGLRKR